MFTGNGQNYPHRVGAVRDRNEYETARLTASLLRRTAVSTLRESGQSRRDQRVLASHMAHRLVTADRDYDRTRQVSAKTTILRKMRSSYVVIAKWPKLSAQSGGGTRSKRVRNCAINRLTPAADRCINPERIGAEPSRSASVGQPHGAPAGHR